MANNQVAVIEKRVNPLFAKAEKFEIVTADDMKEATEMLSEINKIADKIEAEKGKVLKPLLEATKAERARWKPVETVIENSKQLLRTTMSVWQTAQKKIADKKAADIAARVKPGKGGLKAETAIAKIDELDKPDQTVSTDAGTVKFRTVHKLVIADPTKIPRKYLVPDESAIKEALKKGESVPGASLEEEQVPVNFR